MLRLFIYQWYDVCMYNDDDDDGDNNSNCNNNNKYLYKVW